MKILFVHIGAILDAPVVSVVKKAFVKQPIEVVSVPSAQGASEALSDFDKVWSPDLVIVAGENNAVSQSMTNFAGASAKNHATIILGNISNLALRARVRDSGVTHVDVTPNTTAQLRHEGFRIYNPLKQPVAIQDMGNGIVFYPNRSLFKIHGNEIQLTKTEAIILQSIVKAQGKMVSHEELGSLVGGKNIHGNVAVTIVRIREKLKQALSMGANSIVQATWGEGFFLDIARLNQHILRVGFRANADDITTPMQFIPAQTLKDNSRIVWGAESNPLLEIIPASHEIFIKGDKLALHPQQATILQNIITAREGGTTSEDLRDNLYTLDAHPETDVIQPHLRHIRIALGAKCTHDLVVTSHFGRAHLNFQALRKMDF